MSQNLTLCAIAVVMEHCTIFVSVCYVIDQNVAACNVAVVSSKMQWRSTSDRVQRDSRCKFDNKVPRVSKRCASWLGALVAIHK